VVEVERDELLVARREADDGVPAEREERVSMQVVRQSIRKERRGERGGARGNARREEEEEGQLTFR